jgi:hypothetical protein
VPLDAALVSSSNATLAIFHLREVAGAALESAPDASASHDGGVPVDEVPLATSCTSGRASGAVCIGRPTDLLKPLTTYEWSVAMVEPAGLVPGYLQPSDWQRFTTGEESFETTLPQIDARVTRHEIITDAMCVSGPIATLELSSTLVAPVVLNIADVTPEYVTQAVVLTEDAGPIEMTLYSAPDCFTIETFDQTGARAELRELCPEAELPATTIATGQPLSAPSPPDESGPSEDSNTAPADDPVRDEGIVRAPVHETSDQSGCSVSGPVRGAAGLWSLLVMASLWLARSRRRAEKHQSSIRARDGSARRRPG